LLGPHLCDRPPTKLPCPWCAAGMWRAWETLLGLPASKLCGLLARLVGDVEMCGSAHIHFFIRVCPAFGPMLARDAGSPALQAPGDPETQASACVSLVRPPTYVGCWRGWLGRRSVRFGTCFVLSLRTPAPGASIRWSKPGCMYIYYRPVCMCYVPIYPNTHLSLSLQ
jgi:hypothetical protein